MKENIYTIPVSEAMEKKCGCPLCNMKEKLEDHNLEYILGPAMMEPDVRMETNKMGFCREHYQMMLKRKNRLAVALMLESHLKELRERGMKPSVQSSSGIFGKKTTTENESCFVCHKIEWAFERMLDTMLQMHAQSEAFRRLYSEQELLCYPHYKELILKSSKMDKKPRKIFLKDSQKLCINYLDTLLSDISHYCKMFDYRNSGGEWGTSKDSIERTILFLTSQKKEDADS